MISILASLNWTAIIIAIAVCMATPRCLGLTLQIVRVLRDISRDCTRMEELRQRARTKPRTEVKQPCEKSER